MADVFISYSRKNADFVMRLYETLERSGREVWLDLDSIPKGEEFNKMIFDGIDAADVVLFVASRYSLTSEICNTEIAYARSRNKKIIPVMLEAMDDRNPDSEVFMAVLAGWYKKKYAPQAQENWEVLRMINWAIFTPDRDFDTEFKILLQEIETDRPHVRQHTRYIVSARDWKNAEYTPSLLLNGEQIIAAEKWLHEADELNKVPRPTDDQREYIKLSRIAEDEQARMRAEQEKRTRTLRRAAMTAALVGIVAMGFAVLGGITAVGAQQQAQSANATLTPVVGTRAAGETQIAVVATQVRDAQNFASGLELAAYANDVSHELGNQPLGLALALEASRLSSVSQVRSTLTELGYAPGAVMRLTGHTEALVSAVYSPDGARIVTASRDRTAIIWDAETGEILHRLEGHSSFLTGAVFSADGSLVLTTSDDNTAVVWNAETGAQIAQLLDPENPPLGPDAPPEVVAILDGGSYAVMPAEPTPTDASGTLFDPRVSLEDAILPTIDPSSLTEGGAFTLYGGALMSGVQRPYVVAGQFSSDGTRVATFTNNGTILLWDSYTGEILSRSESVLPERFAATGAVFSPNGTRLAIPSAAGAAFVYRASTLQQILELNARGGGMSSAAYSPDGERLVTGSVDGTAIEWNASTGELVRRILTFEQISTIAYSPNGMQIVTGSYDRGGLSVWDAGNGVHVLSLGGHAGGVYGLAYSPDGTHLVTASADGTAIVWDTQNGARIRQFPGGSAVEFSADGSQIIITDYNGRTALDATTGETVSASTNITAITPASFSADHTRVALVDNGAMVVSVRDAVSGETIANLPQAMWVNGVALSPDGSLVATSADTAVMVWDATTGENLRQLQGDTGAVMGVIFSPDGSQIVAATQNNTAIIWDTASGSMARRLEGHTGAVVGAAFSPDGRWIATISDDRSAILWDAATGTRQHRLEGHGDVLLSAVFNADGSQLVTTSRDGTAIVWDVVSGQALNRLAGHNEMVWGAAFSPDGTQIVTIAYGSTILWRNDPIERLQTWVTEHRYVPEFTCEQRVSFGVEPLCSDETSTPTPTLPGVLEIGTPEAAVPEVVAPDAVAPEAVAPEAVAPEAVAPDAVVPDMMTPEAASS